MFAHVDLKRQKTMLLGTLVLLRKSLRNLDPIIPKLRELGARLHGGRRRVGVDAGVRAGLGRRFRSRGGVMIEGAWAASFDAAA